MRLLRLRDNNRDRKRGQSLVEFALVVPILLLIFAGAADLGRIFYTYVAIENAAKEGAMYGARYPLCEDLSTLCPDPNNVEWRATAETDGVISAADLTVDTHCYDPAGVERFDLRDCVPGDRYEVTTEAAFALITPLLSDVMGSDFTLRNSANATVLNRAFDPTPGAGPVKLVLASGARNTAEILANCTEPEPTASGYYRSPCVNDATGFLYPIKFRTGDTITYRIIARNTGGTGLNNVTLTDSIAWPASCPTRPTSMAVGSADYVCTYTRLAPAIPGTDVIMDYEDIYTVDADEIDATADNAIVTVEKPPADLEVFKFVSPYMAGDDGDGPNFGTTDALTVGRTASVSTVNVWFKVIVRNVGGQPATGVAITDTRATLPFGQSNANAECSSAPSSLAINEVWECRYRVSWSADQVVTNTAAATATGLTPDSGDQHTAVVTVQGCSAGLRSIPNLIGLTKTNSELAWTAAGLLLPNLTSYGGSGPTVTQSVLAYSCVPATTAMTITK